jgi:DNA gyrase/topoisomerase IV subunit A
MRLEESKDAVVNAWVSVGNEHVCLASLFGNVLTFPMNEVGVLKAAGKGLTALTLNDEDSVFAAEPSVDLKAGPHVLTALGREEVITPARFGGKRAARGKSLFKRGNFAKWTRVPDVRLGKPVEKPTEGEN